MWTGVHASPGLSCPSVHPNDDGTIVKNRFTTADKPEGDTSRVDVCRERGKKTKQKKETKHKEKKSFQGDGEQTEESIKQNGTDKKTNRPLDCICITLPIKQSGTLNQVVLRHVVSFDFRRIGRLMGNGATLFLCQPYLSAAVRFVYCFDMLREKRPNFQVKRAAPVKGTHALWPTGRSSSTRLHPMPNTFSSVAFTFLLAADVVGKKKEEEKRPTDAF